MKKSILILLVCLVSACGGGGSEEPASADTSTSTDTLQFFANFELMSWSDCTLENFTCKFLDAYVNSDITEFQLLCADGSTFLEGEFSGPTIQYTFTDESLTCVMRLIQESSWYELQTTCEYTIDSIDYECEAEWWS